MKKAKFRKSRKEWEDRREAAQPCYVIAMLLYGKLDGIGGS